MRLHATVVAIGGRGVLLTGPSGSGKSDLALRLIDRGATLVGDDYVDLDDRVARRIATIAGRIEVRGVGIVELASISAIPVALGVDLDPQAPRERLPEPLLRFGIPFVALAPFEASAALKVERALTLYGLPLEPASR